MSAAPTRASAPRLHVLLARDAPYGVVVRRGPTRHTALIGWDRRSDRFAVGQWLRGRVYERRADLSPDGRHLIYFAMNGRWQGRAKGAWTAISRAPYLKAVALFAKGDCWHGGGLFASNDAYWLNDGYGHRTLEDDRSLRRVTAYPGREHYGGECPGVYYLRLQRDGWTLVSRTNVEGDDVARFEKPIDDRWRLRKDAHATVRPPPGRSVYFDTHALVDARTGEAAAHDDWEWADVDGRRLVWAAGGRLCAGRVGRHGLFAERTLHDFGAMAFARIVAPY
jgi:hypothetical protein